MKFSSGRCLRKKKKINTDGKLVTKVTQTQITQKNMDLITLVKKAHFLANKLNNTEPVNLNEKLFRIEFQKKKTVRKIKLFFFCVNKIAQIINC